MAILTKKKDEPESPFKAMKPRVQDEKHDELYAMRVTEADSVPGKHVFGNLYGLDKTLAEDIDFLRKTVEECAPIGNMHIIDIKAWPFGGKKGGVTVIAIIRESHIALHTWLEYNYATLDIYSSGKASAPDKAFDYVVKRLKPKRHQVFNVDRGQSSS